MLKLKLIIFPYLIILFTFLVAYTIGYQVFFIKTGDVKIEMHEVGNVEFILLLIIPFILNQLLIGHRLKLLNIVNNYTWLYRFYLIGFSFTMTALAAALQIGFVSVVQTFGFCFSILLLAIFIPQLKEPINESIPIINNEMLGF